MDRVSEQLSSDEVGDSAFRIFRGQQRAMGELMIVPADPAGGVKGARSSCMGYAQFSRAYRDGSEFRRWFEDLDDDFSAFAAEGPGADAPRLRAVQRSLIDLLRHLDPECRRFRASELTKATVAPSRWRSGDVES